MRILILMSFILLIAVACEKDSNDVPTEETTNQTGE